jgi:hypothetical protein
MEYNKRLQMKSFIVSNLQLLTSFFSFYLVLSLKNTVEVILR